MKKEGRHASHYQQYYWKKGEAEYGKQKKTSKKMVLHSNCMYVNQYDWRIHDSVKRGKRYCQRNKMGNYAGL